MIGTSASTILPNGGRSLTRMPARPYPENRVANWRNLFV